MSTCPICGSARKHAFRARVLARHDVDYWQCQQCGLLQTDEPWWLEESYTEAIVASDTGLVERNLWVAERLSALLCLCFEPRGAYCDIAGGFGLLTRLMRDRGFDYLSERGIELNRQVRWGTGRLARFYAWWATRRLGSLTVADSEALTARYRVPNSGGEQ